MILRVHSCRWGNSFVLSIVLAILAVALGGIMKGAIGAGVPIIAAPALTMIFGVQTAVAILVVPNLLSNVWQAWFYRDRALSRRFLVLFAGGGMLGVVFGTYLLASLPQETLSLLVAFAVLGYILLRVARPGWILDRARADRLSGVAGVLGGMLQGATGISAPASVTFLNAMRLPREAFIATISIFFVAMTALQIPALWSVGIMTGERLVMGFIALGIVFLFMPIGTWLGRRTSPKVFDITMLVVLGVIAAKILFEAVF
ncbi:sulfite exporter TauE/SafE family protein [Roseinatronobacter alkalisoli]|uniref:Probable membrane transporter protein n=1 Tax=Roseinatronobacter alkalisoli TaxID=3028235 RepID=A0ABT5TAF8_9RHOB|nr:sulfite exporter TauE/SafE family protein [Roseinatronobacter sp. HJB301]MDD7972054.1 sulfite exporter TauE/SafE family protein [Roseinatronobacter sp. HJB301]